MESIIKAIDARNRLNSVLTDNLNEEIKNFNKLVKDAVENGRDSIDLMNVSDQFKSQLKLAGYNVDYRQTGCNEYNYIITF